MFKRPISNLALWLFPIVILWVGLGILYFMEKVAQQLFWQAAMFSLVLAAYFLLSYLMGYQGDRFLVPCAACLMSLGLVVLARINPQLAQRQFWWATFGIGITAASLWGLRDYRRLVKYQYLWALLTVGMLLITLFFGAASGGATSWFHLGAFSVEPEELAKIAIIIFLANYLANHRELLAVGTIQLWRFSLPEPRVLGPLAMMVGLSLVLLAAQKSLGTALVFFAVALFMVYLATGRSAYLALGAPMFFGTGFLGYKLFSHVQSRVAVWLSPWETVYGTGNQIAQSLFAIGSGGLFGMGLGRGIGAGQIPESETDFIFAVIAEELGFVGALAVIILLLIIIYRCFIIAVKANDDFGAILACGLGFLFAFEALIILAGVTKLLPLTGLPLPWVSYGGNSLFVHMVMLGFLNNISHVSQRSGVSNKVEVGKGLAG